MNLSEMAKKFLRDKFLRKPSLLACMSPAAWDLETDMPLVRDGRSCFSFGVIGLLVFIVIIFKSRVRTEVSVNWVFAVLSFIVWWCCIWRSITSNLCIKWSNLDTGIVTTRGKNRWVSSSQSLADMIIIKVTTICSMTRFLGWKHDKVMMMRNRSMLVWMMIMSHRLMMIISSKIGFVVLVLIPLSFERKSLVFLFFGFHVKFYRWTVISIRTVSAMVH